MVFLKSILICAMGVIVLSLATSCVNQSQGENDTSDGYDRIIATSVATMQIMERLDVDLVGIPKSDLTDPPERYKDVKTVGTPMSPDMEIVESLNPGLVLGPISLKADLEPKYKESGLNYYFLDLNSVEGMYNSISELGDMLDKKSEADVLIKEYNDYMDEYNKTAKKEKSPRVLVLMGLPGSFVVATDNSYVGSLVKLAGGQNVYAEESQDFISINTEDMIEKNPDIILRAAHALPDQLDEMFKKEFQENDIWKNFDAVKNNKVYDLPHGEFGMSANFKYVDALEILKKYLYGDK